MQWAEKGLSLPLTPEGSVVQDALREHLMSCLALLEASEHDSEHSLREEVATAAVAGVRAVAAAAASPARPAGRSRGSHRAQSATLTQASTRSGKRPAEQHAGEAPPELRPLSNRGAAPGSSPAVGEVIAHHRPGDLTVGAVG